MPLKGLYKVEYDISGNSGRSVMHADDGRMLGGNSAFAHFGAFSETADAITAEISTLRHNDDPNYKAMLGSDLASIRVTGSGADGVYRFEGTSPQMPGAIFRSKMTPLDDDDGISVGPVAAGGIVSGLYSIHMRMLDGAHGGITGIMLLHDGRILGGDGFFYYLGGYSSADGRWKGEILHQEHTPARGEALFGGHNIGIGFAGTCNDCSAEIEATAFAGKRSVRLSATLNLIRKV